MLDGLPTRSYENELKWASVNHEVYIRSWINFLLDKAMIAAILLLLSPFVAGLGIGVLALTEKLQEIKSVLIKQQIVPKQGGFIDEGSIIKDE